MVVPVPLLAVAAFALASPPAIAGTQACRVLTWGTASQGVGASTCNNPPGVTAPQNLRESGDGAGTSPVSTGFPTDALAVNTGFRVRICVTIGGVRTCVAVEIGRAQFGMTVQANPESSAMVCRAATGSVPWVDIQDANPSAVFDHTSSWALTLGGIRFELKQPGITTEPESEVGSTEVNDGEEGGNTYLCVVGANNYVYPGEAPKWSLKEGEGIWKD